VREQELKMLKSELVKHLGLINLITPFIKGKEDTDQFPKAISYIFQNEVKKKLIKKKK
jgi:hypothetical protein